MGTCVYLWLIHVVWQKPHNTVKQLSSNFFFFFKGGQHWQPYEVPGRAWQGCGKVLSLWRKLGPAESLFCLRCLTLGLSCKLS